MAGLHSRRHRRVVDSHIRKETNLPSALLDGRMWEAILLALIIALDAAAGPGRQEACAGVHALRLPRMRQRMGDRGCVCSYGVERVPRVVCAVCFGKHSSKATSNVPALGERLPIFFSTIC